MDFRFYTLGEISPSLTFTATGVYLYDDMCEAIVDHILGVDPDYGTAARDLMDIVAMETPDGECYIEAVYVQGKLVGSMDKPFEDEPGNYVKI